MDREVCHLAHSRCSKNNYQLLIIIVAKQGSVVVKNQIQFQVLSQLLTSFGSLGKWIKLYKLQFCFALFFISKMGIKTPTWEDHCQDSLCIAEGLVRKMLQWKQQGACHVSPGFAQLLSTQRSCKMVINLPDMQVKKIQIFSQNGFRVYSASANLSLPLLPPFLAM